MYVYGFIFLHYNITWSFLLNVTPWWKFFPFVSL